MECVDGKALDAPSARVRDEDWYAERRLDALRFMVEVEKRAIIPNFVDVVMIVGFAQFLPNGKDFVIPGIIRLLVIFLTALLYQAIHKRLARNENIEDIHYLCIAIGVFSGLSWALLILPIFLEPVLHSVAFLLCAAILNCIALVVSNTSSLLQIWAPYCLAFLSIFWIGVIQAPAPFALPSAIGVTIILAAVALFSRGTARQRVEAADTMVENRRLSEDLAEALAHAEFLAYRDPLTGLYNRRALFDNTLAEQAEDRQRHILLIDIDNFKQVNDSFGHDIGDRILIRIAQVMRDRVRELPGEGHVAARIGGEEFAIVLAIANAREADVFAERLREGIGEAAREFRLPDLLGTGSIGITLCSSGETIDEAFRRADGALYRAKQGGRNRVRRRDR